VFVCQRIGAQYIQEHQSVPFIQQVVQELWHPDYDDQICNYWDQKAQLLLLINQEMDRRIKKNRKEFFKPKANQKAG